MNARWTTQEPCRARPEGQINSRLSPLVPYQSFAVRDKPDYHVPEKSTGPGAVLLIRSWDYSFKRACRQAEPLTKCLLSSPGGTPSRIVPPTIVRLIVAPFGAGTD